MSNISKLLLVNSFQFQSLAIWVVQMDKCLVKGNCETYFAFLGFHVGSSAYLYKYNQVVFIAGLIMSLHEFISTVATVLVKAVGDTNL